jgi:fructose-1-phosphate kinase PfkB-like protein
LNKKSLFNPKKQSKNKTKAKKQIKKNLKILEQNGSNTKINEEYYEHQNPTQQHGLQNILDTVKTKAHTC